MTVRQKRPGKHTNWDGVERRENDTGRRETDVCGEHCFYVKKLDEAAAAHKSDKIMQDQINMKYQDALSSKAPLSLVVSLIATVALCTILSVGYTWKATTVVQKEMSESISNFQKEIYQQTSAQNTMVSASLLEIQTGLAVAKSRQEDIKKLIENHMVNFNERRIK